jgi:hypothetical protein
MTPWECYENKWFDMKYIGKYFWPVSVEDIRTELFNILYDYIVRFGEKI